MNLQKFILAATLSLTCGSAIADGSGALVVGGKTFALKSAYAYSRPDPFDESKQSTVIAFSERVLDTKKIDGAGDRRSALSDAMDAYFPDKEERPANVEVMIARADATRPVQQVAYTIPGLSSSASVGAGKYKLDLKRNDDQRIEGTLRSANEADKTAEHGGYYELEFALDVHADAGK
jgi:hypothetical protein